MKVLKDSPLAEITLRKYEKPYNLKKRDCVKKLCLSFGLLQPGDSRDVIVDILFALLDERRYWSAEELQKTVIELRKNENLPIIGIASSNIRRQLRRLRELNLVEKVKNRYRVAENLTISEIVEERIRKIHLESIISRIKEYASLVDDAFKK